MITLRVLGTSVTLLECLRVRAEQDLGTLEIPQHGFEFGAVAQNGD